MGLMHRWSFSEKLVGQNGLLAEGSGMRRHKNKNLTDHMSTNVTVLHCKDEIASF